VTSFQEEPYPLAYVDTYIGTGGHGHTFLGVSMPFGAVQLGPSNINKGWDWCSGYHYSDSIVIGFSHLHLSGTGCSDSGDILFMPYCGKATIEPGTQDDPDSGYASRYTHANEVTRPYYYSLLLDDYNIKAELTTSKRVGYHRYTFPEGKEQHIIINLQDANGDDRPMETYIEQKDERTIVGYRFSKGWSKDQRIYFAAIFSQPVKLEIYDNEVLISDKSLKAINIKGLLSFNTFQDQIDIKVGLSPVSTDNALLNIKTEIPHWNFERVVNENMDSWNNELNKVTVESGDESAKRIFYTALYHTCIAPTLFNDVNKDYRGTDKKVYKNADFNNYTVFSLWDTYRAVHPLFTILQPDRIDDHINTMIAIFQQQGRLPVWHLYGSDTNEMIGIQSVPVVADAIIKGYKGFNYELAYQAMKQSMLSDYKGLNYVREYGYIPADLEKESVAKGLEYAIADWGVAQVAKKLGKQDDYEFFIRRASFYKKYWDSDMNFFRGKNKDGSWRIPFNPVKSVHRNDDYCEGNAWQYTWLVPHDVEGLVSLFGSEKEFVNKLDSLFVLEGDMGNEASGDISGLLGQYAHGNEPGHHTIYLYAFVGEQWKTAEKARYIFENFYQDDPDGLHGNEDCGQMSAWYIFSTLGFYPVNPSNGTYVFGSPLFDKATISLPDNKEFEVTTTNNSKDNIYIQSVELNGKPYTRSYISHKDIMNGGNINFIMGRTPNKIFGLDVLDRPKSTM